MTKDYYWLNRDARKFLERGYLKDGQTPEDRIKEIAKAAEKYLGIVGFANKFESYMAKGWYSLASPVWANFGNARGLPVSCNGSFIDDTMESILYKLAECGTMTKHGAGTSAYFGKLRPRGTQINVGGSSSGPVHFMELYETLTNVVSQSNVRRGSFAAYLDVDHPDFLEFLQIRDDGHPIQNMSIGACISDEWMESMVHGDRQKRKIWSEIIKKRYESGYPYIFFTDTVNNNKPKYLKEKIYASNLCSEIALCSSIEMSFVCVLSSLNLLHYDEWKDTDAVETLLFFLDAVNEEYINKTERISFLKAANSFAKHYRALGLGVLGWHSFLQSKMISFESLEAKSYNSEIFKFISDRCDAASKDLADRFGEPGGCSGSGYRNVTKMAIAPTTSSSAILGQISPSIEPLNSNYFIKDLAKGKFTYRNPYLKKVLKNYSRDDEETWKSILLKGGSVQHLDFLTDHERDVFKTFGEISQYEVVLQAAHRQKYIDQSQSLNLMIPPSTPPKQVSDLLIQGWHMGIKTFYYQRSANPAQELARNILNCTSCEG